MLLPNSVREYSTFGGTTGKTSRRTKPVLLQLAQLLGQHFRGGDGYGRLSSEKRSVSPMSFHKISVLYFPPIRLMVASTGQCVSATVPPDTPGAPSDRSPDGQADEQPDTPEGEQQQAVFFVSGI